MSISTVLCRGDQLLFTPFFRFAVHRFAHSVRERHENVARLKRQCALFVLEPGNQPDDSAADIESQHLIAPENKRRIVAGIDVRNLARTGMILTVEKGSVSI